MLCVQDVLRDLGVDIVRTSSTSDITARKVLVDDSRVKYSLTSESISAILTMQCYLVIRAIPLKPEMMTKCTPSGLPCA